MVTHGGVIREFHRFFRDHLRCQLTDMEPMRVTPNTGVNVFKIVYDNAHNEQTLRIAECLKMHETSHLNGLADDFVADIVHHEIIEKRNGDNHERPDVVPLEAL